MGLTQEEVAEKINEEIGKSISRAMIGHLETGEANPSVEIAKAISKALNFETYGKDWTAFFDNPE